ncbi:MAG TPA: dihydrodipicolinate synthase family protein, partial [Gemmataceae bacterium]|nr:dihydrodipicolinate synthase family protein [Gemmataceae bacterium]
MDQARLPAPLTGIIPPLVTPLRGADELDVLGFDRLIEHVLEGGVHGLFLLGTTGEGPGLSQRLRAEVIDAACRRVAGRVPVLVGVTDPSFAETLRLARRATAAGAQAVVLAPPYYFPLDQPELKGYVERVAGAVALPVFLYHLPSFTKVPFEPETVARLLEIPNVVGLKDSGGDLGYLHAVSQLAASRPDFTVLVGPEEMLAEAIALGAHGGICGGANLAPRVFVDLYYAARSGDVARVRELHAKVLRIGATIYSLGSGSAGVIQGLKCALSLLGICDDFVAEPFCRLEGSKRDRVRAALDELDLLT